MFLISLCGSQKKIDKEKSGSVEIPIDNASLALIFLPVKISSFAIDFPTNLGNRCVPPAL